MIALKLRLPVWGHVAIIATLTIALVAPLPFHPERAVAHAWWDFAHVPAFTLVAWCIFALMLDRGRSVGAAWLIALLLVPSLEFLQTQTGRQAEVIDVLHGWAGATIGMLLYIMTHHPLTGRTFLVAGMVLLTAGSLVYPLAVTHEQQRRDRMFPVLSLFDTRLEPAWWYQYGSEVARLPGGIGWRVRITDQHEYSGVFLQDFPHDWSAMKTLRIVLTVTGDEPIEYWIRAHDSPRYPPDYRERFQTFGRLYPGQHTLEIPRAELERTSGGRLLAMNKVREIGVFFHKDYAGRDVLLHRLEVDLLDAP